MEVIGHVRWIEELTHQRKEVVNKNGDIYEWKRNDEQTVTWIYYRFFSGDEHQSPSHQLKLGILEIPKQAENNWLIPKASENDWNRNFH